MSRLFVILYRRREEGQSPLVLNSMESHIEKEDHSFLDVGW